MKRVFLVLIVALILTLATGLPVSAVDLQFPNGKTVEGLPDEAANAGRSGMVYEACPYGCTPPCAPPCPNA